LSFGSGKSDAMWKKMGTIKLLDPTNKLVNAFLKFSKNGPLPVEVKDRI